MANINPGMIIKGSYWPEPVEIKHIEEVGEYIRIIGSMINSQNPVDQLIDQKELAEILKPVEGAYFTEESWKVFLALETLRYRYASLYDPLLAMNISKIDPLPHQIEAVYGYVLKLPRIRFLIADDPGAGKTIMAGLIIKELKIRGIVKRVLIVVPGHLKDQWRRELSERFEEKFIVISRDIIDSLYAENVWTRENQIITSIDFIKRDDLLPSISASHFDIVIVDEAHKMSAYQYGEKLKKTARYRLGEVLSKNTDHLLFLTATPHKGDPENYRLLLDLLEPGFFATKEMLNESIEKRENPLFIRRMKEDLRNFDGKKLFLPRYVMTKTFNLGADSPNEKKLYNNLSRYVRTQYNRALSKNKKRNIGFALVILQRRLASSTYALIESLKRRKKRLEELLNKNIVKDETGDLTLDFDIVEDLSEEERWKEEELWETLSVAENIEELKSEIDTLDSLIREAEYIIKNEEEIKLRELKHSFNELFQKFQDERDKKILIFSESKDTLKYLEKRIKSWGYDTNTIHGGMRLEERIEAEKIFKNKTQVCIATEAAGEGINLQFCHLMINYDIPWNPNRLEQRMGRIHRYGQNREVYVFNLVAEDTREGKVWKRLFEKLDEIKRALGSDKVFDCIGEIFYKENITQILLEIAAGIRDPDEAFRDEDKEKTVDDLERIKENLGESLATRFIDYTAIKEMALKAREHRLIPEYTESYFKKAFLRAGGRLHQLKEGFISIDAVPYEIRKIADNDIFKKTYGSLLKSYKKVSFDKETAFHNPDSEFVSFGHPLFEAVMEWVHTSFSYSLLKGGIFIDPDGKLDGHILFYEGEIKDGSGDIAGKRLFSFYVRNDEVTSIAPSVMWDLIGCECDEDVVAEESDFDIDLIKNKVKSYAIRSLETYREELLLERKRQAEIKEKYGMRSLNELLRKIDGDLIELQVRKERGENVDLAIRNKKERLKTYEQAIEGLKSRIEKEKTLTMSMPRFIGIVRVKPAETVDESLKSDDEIEMIGMKVSMDYERKNGRNPVDVSFENLGFDIRSADDRGNVRYIEVKARVGFGGIALTQNEWFKAKRFKDDYFIYVVLNAAQNPQLFILQNPAETLEPEEKLEVVRYIIPYQKVKEGGALDG